MKKLAAIFVTLLTAVSCIFEKPDPEFELKVGDRIPDFTVQMSDGTVVASSQLREGAALIMFFHTSCPDCQNTLPSVQKIYDEYKDEMAFVLMSREQEKGEIESFWKERGYTMPYSPQKDRKIYNLFATSRVPRVYICKDGKIASYYTDDPIPRYEELVSDISSILYDQGDF
jgi:peroxiredoxin